MNETKVPENRAYKVTLILLLGLAAFTTAMKELNRLHEMVSSVHEYTREWRGTNLVAPAKPISPQESMSIQETVSTDASCPNDSSHLIGSSVESGSGVGIATASGTEIEKSDCETIIEPEVSAKVNLIAGKRAHRNVPQLARAKFAPVRNLKEEISSIHRDSHWPARVEYKTLDRTVSLELPMIMVTDIKADAFENQVSPESLLGLLGKIGRKQSHGKNEIRRRELLIKRFERSISSRRAS